MHVGRQVVEEMPHQELDARTTQAMVIIQNQYQFPFTDLQFGKQNSLRRLHRNHGAGAQHLAGAIAEMRALRRECGGYIGEQAVRAVILLCKADPSDRGSGCLQARSPLRQQSGLAIARRRNDQS